MRIPTVLLSLIVNLIPRRRAPGARAWGVSNLLKNLRCCSAHMACLFSLALLAFAAPRAASAANPSAAHLTLSNLADYVYSDPQAVAGRVETAGGVVTAGASSFSNGMNLSLTSIPGRGVEGRAYLDDYLTFHVPGGGSAQVTGTISGAWNGTYDYSPGVNADFQVSFTLGLGSSIFQGKAYANPFYDDGNPVSHSFTANRTGDGTGVGGAVGNYSFSHTWTVFDGQTSEFYSSIAAQCGNGGTAYIDDPLSLALPAGVSFTSSSGSTYTPEPASLFLLGAAPFLLILRGRQRSRRHLA